MKKRYALLLLSTLATFTLHAQIDLTVINVPYNQQFDSLASTTTGLHDIGTLPQGWTFVESGTNANTTYAAGTGSSNAGNTYSFGTDATDRALGGLQSGSLVPTIGASFLNQTGTTITALEIAYHGEQWRLGSLSRIDKLDFQYSFDATGLNNGIWTNADNLDFISPVTSGTVGSLNGNSDNNSATITFTIEGLNITNGAMFSIRWTDFNASGADDGLAIDDFTITPIGTAGDKPTISFTPAALSFGEVNAGSVSYSQYEVIGSNLDSPVVVSVSHPAYALSADNISFLPSLVLDEDGGQVYVRFMPIENGPANTIINHASGLLEKALSITGSGFVQAVNIIPVVTARAQAVGTKVTVAGRITVANELGNPAYLQDETGGIPVFDFGLANDVSIGDSVLITGPVGVFNDQKQISGAGIFYTKVDTAPRVLIPETILLSELAAYEGQLVRIDYVELLNKNFVFYPQSTEIITDGSSQADLRIDGDTDIPGLAKPQMTTSITGVVGRFRANAQLLPRFREDMPEAFEPSAPTDGISKNKTLDVVTWNLEFFGAKKEDYNNEEFGPEDEALQLQNIKQVLDSLSADIIAVEEVSDEAMLAALVAQLENYDYLCSHRYSRSFEAPDNSFPPQKVCFIYDTTTIEITGTRAMFENRYDSARTFDPSLLPGYPAEGPSSFYSSGRLPFLITINATIEGVTEKINLIAIHAKSGASTGDWERRAYDAAVLKDSLDVSHEQFIILGDLNDDLDQ